MVMMRLAWNLLEDVGYIDGWGAFEAKWRLMGTSKPDSRQQRGKVYIIA
jgi:hypothetical protein